MAARSPYGMGVEPPFLTTAAQAPATAICAAVFFLPLSFLAVYRCCGCPAAAAAAASAGVGPARWT